MATTYADRIRAAVARAARISDMSDDELTRRCRVRVGHDMTDGEFLLAAADEAGTTVEVLLGERSISEQVRELTKRVRVLDPLRPDPLEAARHLVELLETAS